MPDDRTNELNAALLEALAERLKHTDGATLHGTRRLLPAWSTSKHIWYVIADGGVTANFKADDFLGAMRALYGGVE